jgi:hypothetical protein
MAERYMLSARRPRRSSLSCVAIVSCLGLACAEPERYEPPDGPSLSRPQADAATPGADAPLTIDQAAGVEARVSADLTNMPDTGATADGGADTRMESDTALDGPSGVKDGPSVDASGSADVVAETCPNPPMVFGLPCGCAADGRIRCDGTCSTPDTTCVPTGQFFVLTNLYLGEKRPLDTYGGTPPHAAFMATTVGSSGQFWRITPVGSDQYRFTNMFLGPDSSLEVSADGKKLYMASTANASAQRWRLRAIGNEPGKHFRITNVLVGDGRSMDTSTTAPNDPFLNENGNYGGEYWKLTKAP